MKRKGNIYPLIYDMDNLRLADMAARKNKLKSHGVKLFDKNPEGNLLLLQDMLINKTYQTGAYRTFIIKEPKEREISALDYFPHRVLHHAIMLQIENILVPSFTAFTYSCIKRRGIKAASTALTKALRDVPNTQYCLQIDVKKFYPTIDHDILKSLIRRKIKDNDLLELLDGIIDSAPGVPIGNYLSQFFANLYLSALDHLLKEGLGVTNCFRYADDIVILASNKPFLQKLLSQIKEFLKTKLNLTLKHNYQVYPVAERHKGRGIDFCGVVHYHTHRRLRKTIKQNYAREVAGRNRPRVVAGYGGWVKLCNGAHLVKKIHQYEQF
ncbi:RNA-directed DNA polymerase [uncultured Mucilaginibacter sp.]|uniref:RNA-directed DNA polymerase n=1 Tax=uncultured Mucilaginibacter sp. TaxID=797541 RepID=UPI0025E5824B|nr:RNA-directed DNA polymerase [uncultured Mucilaginibacter sp.]